MKADSLISWLLCGCIAVHPLNALAEQPSTKVADSATEESEEEAAARTERAQTFFQEGRSLSAAARYEEACKAFELSLELEKRPNTEFNLADCYERLGRTASAYSLFTSVAHQLNAAGDKARANVSQRRAEMLQYRLCGLSVQTAARPPGFQFFLQDRAVPDSALQRPIPVDPGVHVVRAAAPDHMGWSTPVEVDACPSLVTVRVPALVKVDESRPAVAVTATTTQTSAQEAAVQATPTPAPVTPLSGPAPEPTGQDASSYTPVLPLAIGAAGLVGVAVGVASAIDFTSKNNAAKEICPAGERCTAADIAEHAALVGGAETAKTWAYVGFGVGAAALGTAVLVYFMQKPDSAAPTQGASLTLSPVVVGAEPGWGATLGGRF